MIKARPHDAIPGLRFDADALVAQHDGGREEPKGRRAPSARCARALL